MKNSALAVLAAALLLAACSSDGSDSAMSGDGSGSGSEMAALPGGGVDGGAIGPDGIVAGSLDEFERKVGNTVLFATDAYTLDAGAQGVLQQQAAWLQRYPQYMMTIEGHADERGTREYNLALGERRAQAVMNYLIALGIDPARMTSLSYGKERPVCPDAGETCWQQNRRGVTALRN